MKHFVSIGETPCFNRRNTPFQWAKHLVPACKTKLTPLHINNLNPFQCHLPQWGVPWQIWNEGPPHLQTGKRRQERMGKEENIQQWEKNLFMGPMKWLLCTKLVFYRIFAAGMSEYLHSERIFFPLLYIFFFPILSCLLFPVCRCGGPSFHICHGTPHCGRWHWNGFKLLICSGVSFVLQAGTRCFAHWNGVFRLLKQGVSPIETKCFIARNKVFHLLKQSVSPAETGDGIGRRGVYD